MKKTAVGKAMAKAKVFRDPSILEEDYLPSRIQHRDKQIKEISYFLSSLVRYGIRSSNIIVFGDPGTGKTHSVRSVLSELKGAIETFYCGAYRGTSVHAFFRRLLEKRFNISLHPRESMSVYYRAFERALEDLNNVLIVIDDIQYLLKDDPKGLDGLLFYLSRLEKKLGLILIGNIRMNDFSEALEEPTKSSLRLRSVYFGKYNALQLTDILMERAKDALTESALKRSTGAIQLIAARTALEWGSARHALDLLKEAGMVSEEIRGEDHISEASAREAERRVELTKTEEQVRDLPAQALAVLEAIYRSREKPGLGTGDVYSVYERVCRERGLDSFTMRKVSDIIKRLDSDGLISCRIVFSGRLGRTRHISWLANPVLEEVYQRERQLFVS